MVEGEVNLIQNEEIDDADDQSTASSSTQPFFFYESRLFISLKLFLKEMEEVDDHDDDGSS